ncbi:MAG: iron-regulated protein [Deltaproteobacteria bacterium]|nr:iron-regulated protein [Deltaproteobacteria bacterium]
MRFFPSLSLVVRLSGPVLVPCLVACSSDGGATSSTEEGAARPVVERYAAVAQKGYAESLAKAKVMKSAIDAFVAAPSQAGLDAARKAWLDARDAYGQTESYRFYDGPIDDERGPEGRVNGWPLDEAFIDYVEGNADAGIVNTAAALPALTKEGLAAENEKGGETNIATGWHAIEFLLWGQDKSETGPGARPFTDYVAGAAGPQKNASRRAAYLQTVTDLLVDDLDFVAKAWDAKLPGSYGAAFVAAPSQESLTKAFKGIVQLAGFELSSERMNNAYTKGDQEEEHSCFSDNTIADLVANARAVENVYLGRWGTDDGPGLDELVRAKAPELDARVKAQLSKSLLAIGAIPAPFDQAVLREPGRSKVKAAIDEEKALAALLVEAGKAVGVTVNIDE